MDLSKKDTTSICEFKRLMFISQSCFHLLRSYIYEIYPDQGIYKEWLLGKKYKITDDWLWNFFSW